MKIIEQENSKEETGRFSPTKVFPFLERIVLAGAFLSILSNFQLFSQNDPIARYFLSIFLVYIVINIFNRTFTYQQDNERILVLLFGIIPIWKIYYKNIVSVKTTDAFVWRTRLFTTRLSNRVFGLHIEIELKNVFHKKIYIDPEDCSSFINELKLHARKYGIESESGELGSATV